MHQCSFDRNRSDNSVDGNLVTVMVVMIVIHGDNDNNNAYDDDDVDAYASFCDCLN